MLTHTVVGALRYLRHCYFRGTPSQEADRKPWPCIVALQKVYPSLFIPIGLVSRT